MNEYDSRHTCEWVTAHIWVGFGTYTHVACQVCMGRVTRMNGACYINEWAPGRIRKSCTCQRVMSQRHLVPRKSMNESQHTWEWDMSHVCVSHLTHIYAFCHIISGLHMCVCKSVPAQIWMGRVTHIISHITASHSPSFHPVRLWL